MRIPTIDGADSVLTNVRYILAGPGCDMVASEAIALDGVVYDKLGLLLIESQASVEYTDIVINSDNRHMIGYTGAANENLIIPRTFEYNGVAYRVTGLAERAFADCRNLLSVSIPKGITTIPQSCFQGCLELASVIIPSSVANIEYQAFAACDALTTLDLPAGIKTIGLAAFWQCHNLASITIPSSVTEMESCFYECPSLVDITINKPEGSISGAPWGATNATVNWLG